MSLSPELSIQPQLNSTLIPPHARAQTSPASHGRQFAPTHTHHLSQAVIHVPFSTFNAVPLFFQQRAAFQTVLPSLAQPLDPSTTAPEQPFFSSPFSWLSLPTQPLSPSSLLAPNFLLRLMSTHTHDKVISPRLFNRFGCKQGSSAYLSVSLGGWGSSDAHSGVH